jgi:RNA polymerase sigma factor (sigma-70 family)
MTPPARNPEESVGREPRLPGECGAFVRKLFVESVANRWQLTLQAFEAALARSANKRFADGPLGLDQLQGYLSALHLKDLALASACALGSDPAWEDFVGTYRPYLRAAAAAILHCPVSEPKAIELADSLLADLFGLTEKSAGQKSGSSSLFRYFHGRSSLKTWLRAVLAQRHIDQIRAERKFESLDDRLEDGEEKRRVPEPATAENAADPRRAQYLQKFRAALTAALTSLEPRDRMRLQLYYAEDCTLAEIGRRIGEHESSASRNLERVRKELRVTVEGLLRTGEAPANGASARPGLDDAQVALCLQYAAEDAPIDLDQIFGTGKAQDASTQNGRVKP